MSELTDVGAVGDVPQAESEIQTEFNHGQNASTSPTLKTEEPSVPGSIPLPPDIQDGNTSPSGSLGSSASNIRTQGPELAAPAQRGRAVVFGKMTTTEPDGKKSFQEPEVNDYANFLSDFGFETQRHEAQCLQTVIEIIPGAIKGSQAAVVLIMLESDTDADLDRIVDAMKGCHSEAQKLMVVHCRVGAENSKEVATCLKNCELADVRISVPNFVIISLTVSEHNLAAEFIGQLVKAQRADWATKGIGGIMQYELAAEHYHKKYSLKLRNGLFSEFTWTLPERMLKGDKYFAGIIGDGSHLKMLDPAVLGALCEEAKRNEDELQHLAYRNHRNRRALIINNEFFQDSDQRVHSVIDCANMRDLLLTLEYEVQLEWNLTGAGLRTAIEKFANTAGDADCCILVVMSHGTLGIIKGTDEEPVKEDDLLKYMRNGPGIRGKPRLVIFQACQPLSSSKSLTEVADGASRVEHAQNLARPSMYPASPIDVIEPTNDQCGMIVAHSTSPGDYAFRGPIIGSRFIRALCATFYEYAHKEDVVSMITRVNFIMTHGFKRPVGAGVTHPMQLPFWTVQTDRKLFLVDTGPLDRLEAQTDSSQTADPEKHAAGQPAEVSEE